MSKPTVSIQIDRANGTYYPGERVTGTVTLTVPSTESGNGFPVKGGVYIDFLAKAKSEWSESNGDDEQEKKRNLSGETVFSHQIRMLVGDSFETQAMTVNGQKEGKTALGEALDFDEEMGTIYIPCKGSERNSLMLNLTTLESECKIDANRLLNDYQGRNRYYLVTSVGHMQKGAVTVSGGFECYKDLYPESTKSEYEYCFVLRVERLHGLKKGTKNVSVRVDRISKDSQKKSFLPSSDSSAEKDMVTLKSGKQILPFSFKLKEDSPGSAYWKVENDTVAMTYSLKAYADIGRKDLDDQQFFITVLPNRPFPRPQLLIPYTMETGEQPLHHLFCCFPKRFRSYRVCAKLVLGRLAYAPGERINMDGTAVTNNSKIPQRAQIVLRAYIHQNGGTTEGRQTKNQIVKDYVLFETVVPEKQKVILTNLQEYQPIRVPSVHPSYSGVYLDSKKSERLNACAKWSYTLEVRLPDWGNGFYCRTPFLVTAISPYTLALAEHRTGTADLELTDPYSIFNYAVSSPFNKKCEQTAPTCRKPSDDKGFKRVVSMSAEPLWTGPSREYDEWLSKGNNRERLQEWKQRGIENDPEYDDLNRLFYRNIVHTYSGPTGSLTRE